MRSAALTGIQPMAETRAFDEIGAAYNLMLPGEAHHRLVLATGR